MFRINEEFDCDSSTPKKSVASKWCGIGGGVIYVMTMMMLMFANVC